MPLKLPQYVIFKRVCNHELKKENFDLKEDLKSKNTSEKLHLKHNCLLKNQDQSLRSGNLPTLADMCLRTGRFLVRHFDCFQYVPIETLK